MNNPFVFQFCQKTYVFTFKIGIFLFCLFFLIVFCLLGNWQWHRYHYKKHLVEHYQAQLVSPLKPLETLLRDPSHPPLEFQHVSVSGHYINELTVLLENRFHQDKMGFEVLTPLQIPGSKQIVLVNRGWIPKPDQALLPKLAYIGTEQHITGYLKLNQEYQFILGNNINDMTHWPLVMQKIDIDALSQLTGQSFYPFILRLDANAPNGYVRNWVISSVIPERHLGYAFQWFAMAFVLLIAYTCLSCDRIPTQRK